MKIATCEEFKEAVGNAGWPSPERMFAGRCGDFFYKVCGVEVASRHVVYKRKKVISETYMVNPDYLGVGAKS